MGVAIYGTARAVRNVTGCPYDPDRFVGEVVGLTNTALGLSNTQHLITAKSDSETGSGTDYDMIDVTGLPVSSDYYTVSTSSQSGTHKLGF
jgi:hypothetical protein